MHNLQWQLRQVGKLRQLIAQIPSRDSNNYNIVPKKRLHAWFIMKILNEYATIIYILNTTASTLPCNLMIIIFQYN